MVWAVRAFQLLPDACLSENAGTKEERRMRRLILLLTVMAATLVVTSGVALAVNKETR